MKSCFLWLGILGAAIGIPLFGLPFLTTALNGGEAVSAESLASLIVAVLTLEATVLIAVFIHNLQRKATEKTATKQEIGAKKILYTELSIGLEAVVLAPQSGGAEGRNGTLSQLLIAYLPYIQDSFSPEQLHHLLQLVDVMDGTAARAVSEDCAAAAAYMQDRLDLFVEKRFIPAMRSQYAEEFSRLDGYHRVLTPLTRSVLEALSGEALPPAAADRLTAPDGSTLLVAAPNGCTKIYNAAGELLCDARLDPDALGGCGIEAGWAKTEFYVGNFQGGLRHGWGCSYSLWGHHKLFEGNWEENEPKTGTQFHTVFEKDPDSGEYEEQFPYWADCVLSHHITDCLTGRDGLTPQQVLAGLYIAEQVWIENNELFYDTDDLIPLADFMKKHDPESFLRVQELDDMLPSDAEAERFDEEADESRLAD